MDTVTCHGLNHAVSDPKHRVVERRPMVVLLLAWKRMKGEHAVHLLLFDVSGEGTKHTVLRAADLSTCEESTTPWRAPKRTARIFPRIVVVHMTFTFGHLVLPGTDQAGRGCERREYLGFIPRP